MKNYLLRSQSLLVYAVEIVCLLLFVLYLGFMTNYYILFFDGTMEMFEFYKLLQVFNKEAFNLAVIFVVLGVILLVFDLQKYRPGLFGLLVVFGVSAFMIMNSLSILTVLPKYKQAYVSLDFSSLEDYVPTTFVFDAAFVLHWVLIGLLVILSVVAVATFIQRLREGNPLIRRLQQA